MCVLFCLFCLVQLQKNCSVQFRHPGRLGQTPRKLGQVTHGGRHRVWRRLRWEKKRGTLGRILFCTVSDLFYT